MRISPESKDMLSMIINAILYLIIWFLIVNTLSFIGWAYSYHSLDFYHWWWHANEYDGLDLWDILSVLSSFFLAFFIVKKINIKL